MLIELMSLYCIKINIRIIFHTGMSFFFKKYLRKLGEIKYYVLLSEVTSVVQEKMFIWYLGGQWDEESNTTYTDFLRRLSLSFIIMEGTEVLEGKLSAKSKTCERFFGLSFLVSTFSQKFISSIYLKVF